MPRAGAVAIAVLALAGSPVTRGEPPAFYGFAERPVMGWNSWDAFATTITEAQVFEAAAVMKEKLAPAGYDVLTIDIQWYEPTADGFTYHRDAPLAMDKYGRLIPASNKFPSGFAAIARRLHAAGLKLGIHVMRGIPRQAVTARLPVLGTHLTAYDIADMSSTCPWNGDMYGIDMARPGAQAYYDSVIEQYADWGVDLIKVDDLSRPYHREEIAAIRRAIDKTGRPIVLSTSPGATPVAEGADIIRQANQWRISDDFWDDWTLLDAQFARLRDWTAYRGPGHFPDADMLPLGVLALGKRSTRFNTEEQRTLMTLWCIARSPLILGADLRRLDPATLDLVTRRAVIAIDQESADNRELWSRGTLTAWTASAGSTRYVALFNRGEAEAECRFPFAEAGAGRSDCLDLWLEQSLGTEIDQVDLAIPRHGVRLLLLSPPGRR